jgi:hypothetical protein
MRSDANRFGLLRGGIAHMVVGHALGLWLIAMLFVAPGFVLQAQAQSCSADSQCSNSGRSVASCVGNTLVVRRSLCAGSCQEVEERRQDCGSRITGSISCSGNIAIRQEGGCNVSSASCDNRTDREVCVATCSCRGNRLTYSSGTCTPGAGCARVTIQCKTACSCSPEPRCS